MEETISVLKSALNNNEKTRHQLMREINRLNGNYQTTKLTNIYPMARVSPLIINNYPVMQFGYDGMLPPIVADDDPELLTMTNLYYHRATFDSYDYSKMKLPIMDKTVIVFVHYFKDMVVRDLDNRSKKYIQDAIRKTGIIPDDNWSNVWNMDVAFKDEKKDHVLVYVVPREKTSDFIGYLMEYHERLKEQIDSLPSKSKYEEHFLKEKQQKRQAKMNKTSIKTSDLKDDFFNLKKPNVGHQETLSKPIQQYGFFTS